MNPLTDEQMSELLARPIDASDGTADAELARLRSALTSYRTETLLWAERRSAAQPSLAAAARRSDRWAALPRWSLATIAIVTIAAGVAHVSESRNTPEDGTQASLLGAAQQSRSSADDIAADNKLLHSIDDALVYRTQSPVDAYDRGASAGHNAQQVTSGDDSEE